MSKHTVALIGFGYWGPNVARNWNNNKRVKLKYICDLKKDRLAAVQLQYPYTEAINDYNKALEDKEVNIVSIATPIKTHYQVALDALLAGKHVLVEKPITTIVAEAEHLQQVASQNNLTIMVGHTFLYSPPVLKIKQYLEDGIIGELDFIQLTRINLGRVKHDFNVIWDLAPHDFSILHYLLDKSPSSIQVMGKASTFKQVCDVAFINLKYPNDLLVNIHLSWISPVKLRQSYIVGKKRMVVYDDTHPTDKIRLYDMGIDVKDPDSFGEFQLSYRSGEMIIPRLDAVEPLAAECDHFIDCVDSSSTPRSSIHHAIEIVKMIEAAQESLSSDGKVVNL